MWLHYFKITFRTFIKERNFAFINLLGLAFGFTACILIAQFVLHELDYDRQHPELDKLYRVNQTNIWDPNGGMMGSSVLPLAEALQTEIPQIESTLRINTPYTQFILPEGSDEIFVEEGVLGADSSFLDFFGFEVLHGNPEDALNEPNTAILTYDMAMKYFGTADAVGKTLMFGDERKSVRVTAVLTPDQRPVHFDFDIVTNIYTNPDVKNFEWSWIWTQVVTYVKLNGDPAAHQETLDQLVWKHGEAAFRRLGMDLTEFEKEKGKYTFSLQPVEAIHLYSEGIDNRIGQDGSITQLYIFISIGLVILFLAIINYVNLSTARATSRAHEIGIKKALGSTRQALLMQLFCETILMSFAALLLAFGLSELLRVVILNYISIQFDTHFFYSTPGLLVAFLTAFFVGIVAGLYPALYMSGFRPSEILKGKFSSGTKAMGFRNGLVILQFAIAFVLIVATWVVRNQLEFFQSSSMGFDSENVLMIHDIDQLDTYEASFVEELRRNAGISESAVSGSIPGLGAPEDIFYIQENSDKKVSLGVLKVDAHYTKLLGLELIAGRNFTEKKPEKEGVILSRLAVKHLGLTVDDVLGRQLIYFGNAFEVIGVVDDFHSLPFYYPVMPVALFNVDSDALFEMKRHLLIRTTQHNADDLLKRAEQQWKNVSDKPYQYGFLQSELAAVYDNEKELSHLFTVFSVLAILIAVFGLVGLSAYIINKRTKEMSIRKVLGASSMGLLLLMNGYYVRRVLLALLLGIPSAWWLMSQWLQQFKFRVSLSPVVFIGAAVFIIIVIWIVVSLIAGRVARVNPVEHLRNDN